MKQILEIISKQRRWTVGAFISLATVTAPASAATILAPNLTLSVFAQGTSSYNHPDSIAVVGNSVFVSYTNGVAPDGTDGKSSTVVQYNMAGSAVQQYSVAGSNDGLKYNPSTGLLLAIHNQDGNSFVTTLNPASGQQSQPYPFSSAAHGGGYDDVAFLNGKTYVSASNPGVDGKDKVNGAPSIASMQISGGQAVLTGILANNASATNIATGITSVTNQTDPDSLTTSPSGSLLLDSQADGLLLFVDSPGAITQTVRDLFVTDTLGGLVSIDDTVFATNPMGFLLLSDPVDNTVYKISSNSFTLNGAYAGGNGDSLGIINQISGLYTPLISGLGGASGEAFVGSATPEPSSSILFALGFGFLVAYGRLRTLRIGSCRHQGLGIGEPSAPMSVTPYGNGS